MSSKGRGIKTESERLLDRAYALASPEEAQSLYRDWAVSYDQHLRRELFYVAPARLASLLTEFVIDPEAKVLDVGCGTGLVGECLVQHGLNQIDGLDFSPEMLAVARAKGVYEDLVCADLNAELALPDAGYDAAICCGTFTHGHVGADALKGILRLIKSGGVLACTVHRDIWQEAGFEEEMEELQEQGVVAVEEIRDQPYFDGAEAEGKYLVLRRR